MHLLQAAFLLVSLPFSWAISSVVSDIIVGWPTDVRFKKMAPWLTGVKMHTVNDEQKVSLELLEDPTTNAIISTENGAGYIIMRQDGKFEHGVQSLGTRLSNGDHVALLVNNEIPDHAALISSVVQLLGPEKFCQNLESILSMRKDAKKGFFCGKMIPLQSARNNHKSYTISGIVAPKKA